MKNYDLRLLLCDAILNLCAILQPLHVEVAATRVSNISSDFHTTNTVWKLYLKEKKTSRIQVVLHKLKMKEMYSISRVNSSCIKSNTSLQGQEPLSTPLSLRND